MPQIITQIKDDIQAVSQLSCFVYTCSLSVSNKRRKAELIKPIFRNSHDPRKNLRSVKRQNFA